MPQDFQCPSDEERRNFCSRLKSIRERKGITLAAIADATKIRASLFAAFERNDLRAWPKAIYRRSYFREYARIIDVPLEESCDEFNRLFTDEPVVRSVAASAPATTPARPATTTTPPTEAAEEIRLVFDAKWHGPRLAMLTRLLAALVDALVVAVFSGATWLVAGIDPVVSVASVSMAYFSLATVIFGESPARWIIDRREKIVAAFHEPEVAAAAEPSDDPERRTWISDATRVGPAPPPQLRVRFKV